MSKLINILKGMYNINTEEAECMCLEEYEESGMDAIEALHAMGLELEPDFVYDFMDIVARC